MLEARLRQLDQLVAAGALTAAELERARAQVIASYLATPPSQVATAPNPVATQKAPRPGTAPVPARGVGPLPRRMVPVALAMGSAVVVDGVVANAIPEGMPSVGSGDFTG